MIWTGGGIGANAHGGVTGAGFGSPVLAMDGIGWYHYRENLVAGAGFRLASVPIGGDASMFTAQYEIHSTMVWPIGSRSAIQIDIPIRLGNEQFYADTLDGTDPLLLSSRSYGSGLLAAFGTRVGAMGFALAGGCDWAWWPASDSARDLEVAWEVEPAVSVGLRRLLPHLDSLSRAFDVVVKVPVQYDAIRLEPHRIGGRSYGGDRLRVGIRVGLAVVL